MVMNCRDVWQASADYIDGELSEDMVKAIDEHLRLCRPCLAVLMGTQNVVEILGCGAFFEVPMGYYERLHRAVKDFPEGRTKARSVWLATAVACSLLAAGALLAIRMNPEAAAIRAPMSQPAWQVPAKLVAISEKGKAFHATSCPLLHGKWHLIKAGDAIMMGYSPCPRCMKEALRTTPAGIAQISDEDESVE